ncbi:MepB family protein [Streptomyces sp. NPDC006529]|uniref:MepB family protein n=1 Tax=Streptomyces sp. NPDC006529 TaxID=3157177 RepID=UPI0033A0C95C
MTAHRTDRAADPAPWPLTGADAPHEELLAAKELVYDPCGFRCSRPVAEAESAAYAAHAFTLDGLSVRFRAARVTPTKAGQFVTVWKRSAPGGPIQPFDAADGIDLFVVSTRDGRHFGQFVFPLDALRRHGVLAVDGVGGKRAFRVYPPWVSAANRQADRAQEWQLGHFLRLEEGRPVDLGRARALYGACPRHSAAYPCKAPGRPATASRATSAACSVR